MSQLYNLESCRGRLSPEEHVWGRIRLGEDLNNLQKKCGNESFDEERQKHCLTMEEADLLMRLHLIYQSNRENDVAHMHCLSVAQRSIVNRRLTALLAGRVLPASPLLQ